MSSSGFSTLAIDSLFDLHLLTGDAYPLYIYDQDQVESGEDQLLFQVNSDGNRKDGITDWALNHFVKSYADHKIKKEDIFNYCYAVLNSPEFNEKYGQDARKAGPRVPLLIDFWAFSKTGRDLINLHANYETGPKNQAAKVEDKNLTKGSNQNFKVKKMAYKNGSDKSVILINDLVAITNIPDDAHYFFINSRSALDWVVNQYQYSQDKSTGLISDPNLYSEDYLYIVDLILRVIEVSVQTLNLHKKLPPFNFN
jgi:predicted helicase